MSTKRLLALARVVCAVAATLSPARADQVSGLRSTLVEEVAHRVAVELDRGHATLVVQRTVFNGGPRHDQATFFVDLPEGAVATGLRTLGSFRGRPKWYSGDLLQAEAAAAKYRELTGIGGYAPKDPALLSWRSQRLLALQVFPCPPRAQKKVEYTLEIPTRYSEGEHELLLEPMGTPDLLAELSVTAKHPGDRVTANGVSVNAKDVLHFKQGRALSLRLIPSEQRLVSGTLAGSETAEQRHLTHVELFLAPKLSKAPEAADVVIIIDASRSMPDDLRQGMLAAARAYLSHLPQAQVAVVTFDRLVHTPLGGFAPAAQAMLDLQWLDPKPQNGSDVEAALLTADKLLEQRPPGPTRRIILFTDALTHSKMTAERLAGALPASHALLHIGVVTNYGAWVERDDAHAWQAVARSSGGLVWRAAVSPRDDSFEALKAAYEEWVRPLRIHHLSLDSHSRVEFDDVPATLREGAGYVNLGFAQARVASVTLRGELWTEPIQRTVGVSRPASRLWSALVFGSSLLPDLSEAEMQPLAFDGGAVSPVTSYLAIEPGVRPSTEGIPGRVSGSHRTRAPTVRMGGTMLSPARFDRQGWLETMLSRAWRDCGGHGTVSIGFETTKSEVVLVDEARGLDAQRDGVAERCLSGAIWALDLPDAFDRDHDGWQLFVEA